MAILFLHNDLICSSRGHKWSSWLFAPQMSAIAVDAGKETARMSEMHPNKVIEGKKGMAAY